MILKNNNYDFKITSYNKDYDRSDNTYYDDLISTMDRLDKIDEKNEREKYFDNFQEEKNELHNILINDKTNDMYHLHYYIQQ